MHRTVPYGPWAASAELFQARAALAIPLLRALAGPLSDTDAASLRAFAMEEALPVRSVRELIHREMAFHTVVFAAFANPALSYISELVAGKLDSSLARIETPIVSCIADELALPSFDAIIALLRDGYGDESARAAHHRADVIHEAVFCRSCHSVSTAARSVKPDDVRR